MASAKRLKVNLDILDLSIVVVSFGLTFLISFMTWLKNITGIDTTYFKNSTFQMFSHLNALISKFDRDVK